MARAFGEVAERLRRSTVEVRLRGANGGGSGVIASSDGQIVTNAHVARDAGATVRLWDGREFPAILLARDARRDLADVRLAPGNSGGPLADANGRVIGINTMIVNGLGAAVPGNAVKAFLRRGAAGFSLGVTIEPVRLEDRRFGLLVLKVEPGSPAARAPLWIGDVLTGAGGRPFRTVDDLHLLLDGALDGADAVIHLQFVRGDRAATREVAIRLAHPVAEAA